MKILAIAHPNKEYRWHRNLVATVFEAQWNENRLTFYEVSEDKKICRSEDFIREFFVPGFPVADQPFKMTDNRDFYAVLNRHRRRFHQRFIQLKNSKFVRTR